MTFRRIAVEEAFVMPEIVKQRHVVLTEEERRKIHEATAGRVFRRHSRTCRPPTVALSVSNGCAWA